MPSAIHCTLKCGVYLIWIQFLNDPFILCSVLAFCNPGVCAQWHNICYFTPPLGFNQKLHSASKCENPLDVQYIPRLSQYFGQFVFKDLCIAQFPLPFAAHSCWLQIWPYMVIHCSLPDRLPRPFPRALPLAASCSVGALLISGIGQNVRSAQDDRIGLKSDVVSVRMSFSVFPTHI